MPDVEYGAGDVHRVGTLGDVNYAAVFRGREGVEGLLDDMEDAGVGHGCSGDLRFG